MIFKRWSLTNISIPTRTGVVFGTGEVLITHDSRVIINVDINQLVSVLNGHFNISADEASGLKLEASDCLIVRNSFNISTKLEIKPLRCKLYDPSLAGQLWDEQIFTLKNAKFYSSGNFTVATHQCELRVLQNVNVQNIVAGDLTSELKVTSTNPMNQNLSQFAYDICMLISLAQRCPVYFGIVELKSNGRTSEIHLNEMTQDYVSISPLIDFFANDICSFVQIVWPNYVANGTSYGLNTLIDYYWRAHQETYAEIKLVFACIFMEALKFNWARSVSTNVDIDAKANGLIRGFKLKPAPTPDNRRNISFEQLLVMASNSIGYAATMSTSTTVGTFTFIEDRNAIFHSGLSGAAQLGHSNSWPYLKPVIYKMYDQMDELILRILNFSGKILTNNNSTRNFP